MEKIFQNEINEFLNKEIEKEEKEKNECDEIFKMKFKTKKYYINEKGKKRRIKKERKYKSDDIRKKIKVKFHKTIKNIINKNLKEVGSRKYFKFLPQIFMGNITQKFNYKYLEYSYKDLLLTDFALCQDEYRNKKIDYKNYLNNKDTVEYLEQNETISINSGFSLIKNMKYKDIINAYFSSKQFEYSILELKTKKENFNYIQDYIRLSKNYLDYFSHIEKAKEIDKEIDNYLAIEYLDNLNKHPDDYENFLNNNN